jgi:DNA-binding MltR family transcriptional regulator
MQSLLSMAKPGCSNSEPGRKLCTTVPFLLLPSRPLLKQMVLASLEETVVASLVETVVALLVEMVVEMVVSLMEMVVSLVELVVEKLLAMMGNMVEVMERLRLDPAIFEIRWCTSEIEKFTYSCRK